MGLLAKGGFVRNKIIFIGTGSTAKNVETLIEQSPGKDALLGYVETPMDPISVDREKIIGHIDNIVELAQQLNARAIVFETIKIVLFQRGSR